MDAPHQGSDALVSLKVCVRCDRYMQVRSGVASAGAALADRLELALLRLDRTVRPQLRRVECLSGCWHPGNISIGAIGQPKIRLRGVGHDSAAAIIQLAEAYCRMPFGSFQAEDLPGDLAGHLSVSVEPQISIPAIVRSPAKPASQHPDRL